MHEELVGERHAGGIPRAQRFHLRCIPAFDRSHDALDHRQQELGAVAIDDEDVSAPRTQEVADRPESKPVWRLDSDADEICPEE